MKPTSDNSTMRSPSYVEFVNTLFPDSPFQNLKKIYFLRINKPYPSPPYKKSNTLKRYRFLCINTLNELYILRVTVTAVITLFHLCFVKKKNIIHLSTNNLSKSWRHIRKYITLYGKIEHFDVIHEPLILYFSGLTPEENERASLKWAILYEVHIIWCVLI